MFGGHDGTLGIRTWNGEPIQLGSEIARDGFVIFRSDTDEFTFEAPSGGGYGDPKDRDPSAIETDLRQGIVTPEGAERDYGYRSPMRR
jgi:N-methylhydantoinase B/oxoprolinase/acetone carboxylase alpha subunit